MADVTERRKRLAAREYAQTCRELLFRRRGRFLYIDAYRTDDEPRAPPLKMCWIEWRGQPEKWGFGFYRCSTKEYERNVTITGAWTGTPEECFAAAAFAYLREYPSGISGSVD